MIKYGTYNSIGEKWCSRCKNYHPLHEFGKNNRSNDSRDWRCIKSRKRIVIENITTNTPTLNSQVNWSYQRPDFYDLYISKTKQLWNTATQPK